MDATGIVVLRFTKRHAVEIERAVADALIEEVITRQFDVEPMLEQVFADTKGEHGVGGFDLEVGACVAMRVHVEVGLQEPVVRQGGRRDGSDNPHSRRAPIHQRSTGA